MPRDNGDLTIGEELASDSFTPLSNFRPRPHDISHWQIGDEPVTMRNGETIRRTYTYPSPAAVSANEPRDLGSHWRSRFYTFLDELARQPELLSDEVMEFLNLRLIDVIRNLPGARVTLRIDALETVNPGIQLGVRDLNRWLNAGDHLDALLPTPMQTETARREREQND